MISKYRLPVITAVLIAFVLLSISIASCSLFTEPEPYVNGNAGPTPVIKIGELDGFKSGQHVGGTINLGYAPGDEPRYTYKTALYIDSTKIGTLDRLPYLFTVNTSDYSQSSHQIRLDVWRKYNKLGIDAGLKDIAADSYVINLVFDQTSPVVPAGLSITNTGGMPHLSWTVKSFSSFYCYIIKRNGIPIDSLFSQSDFEYIDSSYILTQFDRVTYSVGASNGGNVSFSPYSTLQYGKTLNLDYTVVGLIDNINSSVLYKMTPSPEENLNVSIATVSTMTGSPLVKTGLWVTGPINEAVSPDGSKIYLLMWWYGMFLVHPQDLSLDYSLFNSGIHLDGATAFAADDSGNFYYSDNTGNIHIKTNKGVETATYKLFDGAAKYMYLSPDGSTMLAVDRRGIESYSVSGDSVVLKKQSEDIDDIRIFRVDWNNSRIFIVRTGTTAELWNTETLKREGSFSMSPPLVGVKNLTALTANPEDVFAAYTFSRKQGYGSVVVEYDIASKMPVRRWNFNSEVRSVLGSDLGRYIFVNTAADQWVVDIKGNQ